MRRVALVDTNDPEKAYQLTNNIDQSWIKNPGVYTSNLPETRSTSVGDMIVDGSPGDPGSMHIVIEPLGLRTLSREEICSITYHIQ
jgi:hypothetical protein